MRSYFIKTSPSFLPSQTLSLRNLGTKFSVNRTKFTTTPDNSGGSKPQLSLLLRAFTALALLYGTAVLPLQAATTPVYTVLHHYDFSANHRPVSPVTVASDGSLYGTTFGSGTRESGTVWKINPAGEFSDLHNFGIDFSEGIGPFGGVTIGNDGSLYGTTRELGTVWKINPTGELVVLHKFGFGEGNGRDPYGEVTLSKDGSLYGTTDLGGTNDRGTIWKISPDGVFSVLHSFEYSNGIRPFAGVALASDGSLYGTTSEGGASNRGTLWKLDSAGTFSVLHHFEGSGVNIFINYNSEVTLGRDGSLYGTTFYGGADENGTVWKFNPTGAFSVLHNFDIVNGANPRSRVSIGSDGSLYGTTLAGGTNRSGTIWKINPVGDYSVLHHFDGVNGLNPYAGVAIGINGNLYGTTLTTTEGVRIGLEDGIIYRLTLPSSDIVGDVNSDGKIDRADFRLVKASLGKKMGELGFNAKADINNDKVVNSRDLLIILQKLPDAFCAKKSVNLP